MVKMLFAATVSAALIANYFRQQKAPPHRFHRERLVRDLLEPWQALIERSLYTVH